MARVAVRESVALRLDPALIGTDLEAFGEALEAVRSGSGDARLAACRRAPAPPARASPRSPPRSHTAAKAATPEEEHA
jgi:hypothetical protein